MPKETKKPEETEQKESVAKDSVAEPEEPWPDAIPEKGILGWIMPTEPWPKPGTDEVANPLEKRHKRSPKD